MIKTVTLTVNGQMCDLKLEIEGVSVSMMVGTCDLFDTLLRELCKITPIVDDMSGISRRIIEARYILKKLKEDKIESSNL